jgi:YjbE family integral membrane protein
LRQQTAGRLAREAVHRPQVVGDVAVRVVQQVAAQLARRPRGDQPLVDVIALPAAPAAAHQPQLAVGVPAPVADPAAEVPGAPRHARAGDPLGGGGDPVAQLGRELGADPLVGVDAEHPVRGDLLLGEVLLGGVARPVADDHPGAPGPGDLDGAVGAAGVHDQHLVGERHRVEAVPDAVLLVAGDDADGQRRAAPGRHVSAGPRRAPGVPAAARDGGDRYLSSFVVYGHSFPVDNRVRRAKLGGLAPGEGTTVDFGILGSVTFDAAFFSALASVVLIDLILAGDNAVVIAMAVRSLPREQRGKGIMLGAGAAVLLRVAATFFVAQLLRAPYVKLVGGVLIGWIAVKLFVEGAPEQSEERTATSVWQAVRVIVVADITMALDNMLAVGGASHGNLFLLLFGLALSIPFVVFTSGLLSMLMDRYPAIVYVGAAVLGKVAAEMVLTDPVVVRLLAPPQAVLYAAEALSALGVIVAGRLWLRFAAARAARGEPLAADGAGAPPRNDGG